MELKNKLRQKGWILLVLLLIPCSIGMIAADRKNSQNPVPTGRADGLVISEVCVRNSAIITPYGNCDYIELSNPTEDILDLSGIGISDYPTQARSVFPPNTFLQPGAIVLLPCNSEILPFGLKAGEILSLFDTDGSLLFSMDIPFTEKDQVVLLKDGSYDLSMEASPGYPNTAEGRREYAASVQAELPLIISELCAKNISLVPGGDWVEIQNVSDSTYHITDLYLTDDPADPYKFKLPSESLEPGQCLLASVGSKFGLKAGETVCLTLSDGRTADSLTVLDCETNQSQGKDGLLAAASPGYPNTKEGVRAYNESRSGILITEAMSWNRSYLKGPFGGTHDYIEICNLSDKEIDLSSLSISKSADDPGFSLGEGKLQPGAYAVFFAEKDGSHFLAGYTVLPFGISSSGDELYLFADGKLADALFLPALGADEAFGRSVSFENGILESPSPGSGNGELRP